MNKKTSTNKSTTTTTAAKKPPAIKKITAVAKPEAATLAAAKPADVERPVMAPPSPPRVVARGEFEAIVRREAHALAQGREFRNGSAFEDWITAENAVYARLASEGATVERLPD